MILSRNILAAIIFIEGFVSISVEIIAMRQLLPFVGNSVVVTSLIIGIFLLFLALGYLRGGQIQSDITATLQRNFIYAALMIGFGLSYLVIAEFFTFFLSVFKWNDLIVLTLYLLLTLAPIVYWLGQTIPLSTNLFKQQQRVAVISATSLFFSTLGSFLGAIASSLVLFYWLGVAWTVFINFMLLGILAILLAKPAMKTASNGLLAVVAIVLAGGINVGVEHELFVKTNQWANYQIVDDFYLPDSGHGKALIINNSISSFLDPKLRGSSYIETIKRFLFKQLALKHKQILVLGAGGFTLSAEQTFDNHWIYVDIDSELRDIVKKHYLSTLHGEFIAADARQFMTYSDKLFDVIISDSYKSRIMLPDYLISQEHLQNINKHLVPGGIAVFNIIANPLFSDAYSKRINATIARVFPNCTIVPEKLVNAVANILYFCRQQPTKRAVTYSDNRNRASVDFYLAHY